MQDIGCPARRWSNFRTMCGFSTIVAVRID